MLGGLAQTPAWLLAARATPLRLFASRERSGALVARVLVVSGMFSMPACSAL